MSKKGYLSRYMLILKKLKTKPFSTYKELQTFIERQVDFLQVNDDSLNIGSSKRTLQRDFKEIRNIFGIDIQFSHTEKGYFICQNEMEQMNFQRMIEAFDMFHSLNLSQNLLPDIHLEKRKPQGTEHLYGLLHSIKNRLQIKFEYQKFWEEAVSCRIAAPYALKEFKNRWYLIAEDVKDKRIKTFALDRFSNLEIINKTFERRKGYDVEKAFRYCFGIIGSDSSEPQDVVLTFDPVQGKYIKTLPLHFSQQLLVDDEDEVRIKLTICITHDLIMELLSFGAHVKVLQPEFLAAQIKAAHLEAFKQYD